MKLWAHCLIFILFRQHILSVFHYILLFFNNTLFIFASLVLDKFWVIFYSSYCFILWFNLFLFFIFFFLFLLTYWKIGYRAFIYAFITLTLYILFMEMFILLIELRFLLVLYFLLFLVFVFIRLNHIGCYFDIRVRVPSCFLCYWVKTMVIVDFIATSWKVIKTVHAGIYFWTRFVLGLKLLFESVNRTRIFVKFWIVVIIVLLLRLFIFRCEGWVRFARLLNMIIRFDWLKISTLWVISRLRIRGLTLFTLF